MDLKSTYNKIAENWVEDHRDDDWWQAGTDKFLSLLPHGASIIDIGCGGGVKSRYLKAKGFEVTGVDFSEKMIEIAERESVGIKFEVGDIYEIDKYPETFDGVFAQAVLLHIPKSRVIEVFKKLKSKLKPGGLLYVAVKAIPEDGSEEAVKKENDYGYEYERFFSFFTLPELEKYFRDIGLSVVWKTITPSGRTKWLQIVGKIK